MKTTLKNILSLKLKTKIIVLTIFQISLVMGITGFTNVFEDFRNLDNDLSSEMQQIVNAISTFTPYDSNEPWEYYQEYIDDLYRAFNGIVYIAIFDRSDSLAAYIINEDLVEYEPGIMVTDSLQQASIIAMENRDIGEASLDDLGNVSATIRQGDNLSGRVNMGYSKVDLNNRYLKSQERNIYVGIIFIVLGFLSSFFIAKSFTKPLTKLSDAMETLPQGNTDLLIESKDEFGLLSKSFNYMVLEMRANEFFDQFERDLSKALTIENIFNVLITRLGAKFNITKGAMFIKNKSNHDFDHKYQLNCNLELNDAFHLKLFEILETHIKKDETTFSLEGLKLIAKENPILRPLVAVLEANNIYWTAFLVRQNNLIGVIYFVKQAVNVDVRIDEKKFIVNLVNHTILPIENAMLYSDLTEQERFKKEIEIAQQVQANLLPQKKPEFDGFDIHGLCLPAKEIGGDYFDLVEIDENRLGIVIADVVGKGTSAAFYMAEIKGMIVVLSKIYKKPDELLIALNQGLFANVDRKVFATMIYGILNKKTKEFSYARAGHNSLLYKNSKDNSADYFTPPGIGLGLDKGKVFDKIIERKKIKLSKDDILFLYTDGVSEAMNRAREEYGEDRLKEFIMNSDWKTSADGCVKLLDSLREFSQGEEQFDDITMVMIRAE